MDIWSIFLSRCLDQNCNQIQSSFIIEVITGFMYIATVICAIKPIQNDALCIRILIISL